MSVIPSSLASRPLYGFVASAAALLLCLFWHPTWLAPVLVIALTAVWIVETRRNVPVAAEAPVIDSAPVREALEDVRGALVDEMGHASRELHQAMDLLRDAVSELGGGFDGLSQKTGMQQSLLKQIIDVQNGGVSVQDFAARTGLPAVTPPPDHNCAFHDVTTVVSPSYPCFFPEMTNPFSTNGMYRFTVCVMLRKP